MKPYKCKHGYGITRDCPKCKAAAEADFHCKVTLIMLVLFILIIGAMFLTDLYFPS